MGKDVINTVVARRPSTADGIRWSIKDDFASLFAFNRWANARMLDACRKLTPEQYAAEPVPGWSSVRATVCHIAVVTELWLRGLANDPDDSLPTEGELPTVDEAQRLLERPYRRFNELLPTLTPDWLATPVSYSRRVRASRHDNSLATAVRVELGPARGRNTDSRSLFSGTQANVKKRCTREA